MLVIVISFHDPLSKGPPISYPGAGGGGGSGFFRNKTCTLIFQEKKYFDILRKKIEPS